MTPGSALPADALSALRDAVGPQWVQTGEEALQARRDPFSVLADDPMVPAAVVSPGSVEEVRKVVTAAGNHHGEVYLWPVSRGKNLAYGGSAPRHPGSVLLDLSRMNKIEVDEKFGYAEVEPGVSYADLHQHLTETGSGYWADVPDLEWGSVVGNALERGNGYTPYGDHFATMCGMEVVLPDGDVLRTGMGALPGSNTWHLFNHGFGPDLQGLFTQSNLGIVTKIGVWLMPRPADFRPYMIILPREEDIAPAADIMRVLRMRGTMQNTASVRSLLLEAAASVPRSRYVTGDGPVPADLYPDIAKDLDIGQWNLYGALYGTDAMMSLLWEEIRDAFSRGIPGISDGIPGVRFCFAGDRPPGSVLEHRAARMAGVPGMEDLKILDWPGPHGGHINFSPVSPAAGQDALKQYTMTSRRCREHGLDYLGDMIVGVRELHHIVLVVFDTTSPQQKTASHELFRQLTRDAAQAGYGVYRAPLCFMDEIAATFSENDHSQMRTYERLKDALDPNGILGPGKQGVWPARLRGL